MLEVIMNVHVVERDLVVVLSSRQVYLSLCLKHRNVNLIRLEPSNSFFFTQAFLLVLRIQVATKLKFDSYNLQAN